MRKQTAISLSDIISAIFILVFAYAAFSKILDYDRFKAVLSVSPAIGRFSNILSWLIPVVEIVTSIFLLLPGSRFFGLWISFALMFGFTIYLSYMILFVPNLPCSCGGILSNLSWGQHLVFNSTLLALSILGILIQKRSKLFIAIDRRSRIPV